MNRTEKEQTVEALTQVLSAASFVSLVRFHGLNVADISTLRRELRKAEAEFRVVKNTLARRAVENTDLQQIAEHFVGSTAVAFSSKDAAATAKVLVEFAKDHPHLEFKAGVLDGKVLSEDNLQKISKLPSREVLYAMLLGALQSRPAGLVNVLAGVLRKFMGVLRAIEHEKEGTTATE